MLTGAIFLTSDSNRLSSLPMSNFILVNMDEEKKLSKMIPNCIEGTCLLPPVDAKIAEIDGDEVKYNSIYLSHLYDQQDFMSAIIAFLYKGGEILMYLPDEYNYTKQKLLEFVFQVYGIHIGDLEDANNSQCFYNFQSVPFWLNILYMRDLISWLDWVKLMPLDAYSPDGVLGGNPQIFMKAVYDMNPFTGNNKIEDKVSEFREFHKKVHLNPDLKPAIRGI